MTSLFLLFLKCPPWVNASICDRVYRFAPFRMSKEQREAIHSYDEHIGVDDFLDGVHWYERLVERLPE